MSTNTTASPWLRRVRALLAKAEATDHPPEAEAFLAKAQELMTRHAIDEATARSEGADHGIVTVPVTVTGPYAGAKANLLGAVVRANDCRMILDGPARTVQRCFVVGRRVDVDSALVLFGSLSLQAVRSVMRADPPDRGGLRAFRHAFLVAYAARIGERLRTVRDEEWSHAARERGPGIVLHRDRTTHEVDAAVRAQFPWLRPHRSSVSSTSGYRGGRTAADGAVLGHRGLAGPLALEPRSR